MPTLQVVCGCPGAAPTCSWVLDADIFAGGVAASHSCLFAVQAAAWLDGSAACCGDPAACGMLPACVHRQCATVACATARDAGAQLAAHCPCLANLAGGGSSMLAAMSSPYSLGMSGGWTRFCVLCSGCRAQHAGLATCDASGAAARDRQRMVKCLSFCADGTCSLLSCDSCDLLAATGSCDIAVHVLTQPPCIAKGPFSYIVLGTNPSGHDVTHQQVCDHILRIQADNSFNRD